MNNRPSPVGSMVDIRPAIKSSAINPYSQKLVPLPVSLRPSSPVLVTMADSLDFSVWRVGSGLNVDSLAVGDAGSVLGNNWFVSPFSDFTSDNSVWSFVVNFNFNFFVVSFDQWFFLNVNFWSAEQKSQKSEE